MVPESARIEAVCDINGCNRATPYGRWWTLDDETNPGTRSCDPDVEFAVGPVILCSDTNDCGLDCGVKTAGKVASCGESMFFAPVSCSESAVVSSLEDGRGCSKRLPVCFGMDMQRSLHDIYKRICVITGFKISSNKSGYTLENTILPYNFPEQSRCQAGETSPVI
jgi:hypothetical protein